MSIAMLLKVKKLKADKAEQALHSQGRKLKAARVKQKQAEVALSEYHQWRLTEETRLFESCQAEPIDSKGLERWQAQVALLREKEADLDKAIAEAKQAVVNEQSKLQSCKVALHQAQQQVNKFDELHEQERQQMKAEQEYKEEQEQEEFRSKGIKHDH